jgi:CubicO group peptidase (beta-lactamase class C family)
MQLSGPYNKCCTPAPVAIRYALALLLSTVIVHAEPCPDAIRGGWEGTLPAAKLFGVSITIRTDGEHGYAGRLRTAAGERDVWIWRAKDHLRFQASPLPLNFDGRLSGDGNRIDAFINYASNLYRITLRTDGAGSWSGRWTALDTAADSVPLDLYFDDDGEGGTGGYFFFRNQRLPGLFGYDTRCAGRKVSVGEKNLGLRFDGEFDDGFRRLEVTVAGPAGESRMTFTPMSPEPLASAPGASEQVPRATTEPRYRGEAPEATDDGWATAAPASAAADVTLLGDAIDAVTSGEFPSTHAILIARAGKLVFEQYFYGYDRDTPHDMRSASKSITSALVGIAIDKGLIGGSGAPALAYLPQYREYANWSAAKARIRIRDLLTMSSGLDANDSDRNSVASEDRYQYQTGQPDWIKLALDAPMVAEPGAHHVYGSANPMILGGILASVTGDRVEWFAETNLFAPLGIDDYRIFLDPAGVPYMGGGMHLRPRDMLKFGQMYLDHGRWLGRRVLSDSWVRESFGMYGRLEPLARNGNEYGYLWWHEVYDAGGQPVASVEARGHGGQYIFVVPGLDTVVVITSGNYGGGLEMTRQPQHIFRRYLLPALTGAN